MKQSTYTGLRGGRISQAKSNAIVFEVLILLTEAEDIIFKDGEYNPLKKTSIKRWIQLGKLGLKFIFLIIKILKK